MPETPIGEVILAATTHFVAQVIAVPTPSEVSPLPDPPPFGALVRVGTSAEVGAVALPDDFDPFVPSPPPAADASGAVFAVVYHAETGALEPGRPVAALGLDEEALLREHPQLYELLVTRFSSAFLGHVGADGAWRPYLPPRPPRPHSRVWMADDAEVRFATCRLDFLRGLLLSDRVPASVADELVIALLRRAWRAHGDPDFPLRASRALAALLPADYERLRALVAGIEA